MAKTKQRWVPDEHGGRWKPEAEVTLDDLEAIERLMRKLHDSMEKGRRDRPSVRRKRGLGT